MGEGSSSEDMRKFTDALRSGARMVAEVCPECGSPLFEVSGELRCLKCDKKVIKVSDESEVAEVTGAYILRELDECVLRKIDELVLLLSHARDVEEMKRIGEAIEVMLSVLLESRKLRHGRR